MFKFPSIELLHNLMKDLRYLYPEGNLPTLTFRVTPKLDGTNAGVAYNGSTGELTCMSRERVIVPGDDNFGFAAWIHSQKDKWVSFFNNYYGSDVENHIYVLWGEWAGSGVNGRTSICQVPKAFYVFEAANGPVDATETGQLAYLPVPGTGELFKNIYDWEFPQMTCDFSDLESIKAFQEALNTLTLEVENECPVAKTFGVAGLGEGVVLRSVAALEPFRLKSKGDKHSVVKQKVKNEIDPEVLASKREFAEKFVTEARLTQAIDTLSLTSDLKNVGPFLQWINKDIQKESKDELELMGLTYKDVQGEVTNRAKQLFMDWVKSL